MNEKEKSRLEFTLQEDFYALCYVAYI